MSTTSIGLYNAVQMPRYLDFSKKLPNGITYWVMPNRQEIGKVYLSAVIKVGSIHERANQFGLAHFLEHLAFLGTESFAPGEIKSYLESVGVQFGPDLNATTSLDRTEYKFSIPADNPLKIEKGIQILYEMLFQMKIHECEVAKERNVILEEERQRTGREVRIANLVMEKLFQHTQPNQESLLKSYTIEDLQNFYNEWYTHPELVGVIAVGDLNPVQVEGWIRHYFGRVPAASNPITERPFPLIPQPPQFHVHKDPGCKEPSLSIFKKMNIDRGVKDCLEDVVFDFALTLRIEKIMSEQNPLFPEVGMSQMQPINKNIGLAQTSITPVDHKIKEAVRLFFQELYRIQLYRFNETEIELIKNSFHDSTKELLNNVQKIGNELIAGLILSDFLHRPQLEFSAQLHQQLEAIPSLTAEDVAKRVDRLFVGQDTLLLVEVPENYEEVTEQELKEIISEVAANTHLLENIATVKVKPLPTNLPPPGTIIAIQDFTEAGIRQLTFENGVQVVLKQMPASTRSLGVIVCGFRGSGSAAHGRKNMIIERLGSEALSNTGITGYTISEIQQLLQTTTIQIPQFALEMDSFEIRGATFPENIDTLLKLFHFKLNDSGFIDSQEFDNGFQLALKSMEMEILNPAKDKVPGILMEMETSNHPITKPITLDELQEITLEDVREACRSKLSHPTAMKFVIVGELSLEEMEALACNYLGNLPASQPITENAIDLKLSFPATAIKKTYHLEDEPEKATAYLIFSCYTGNDQKKWVLDGIAQDIMESRLTDILRMDKRLVYTPELTNGLTLHHPYNFGTLRIKLTGSIQQIDAIRETAQQALRSLVDKQQDEVLQNLLDNAREALKYNQKELHLSTNFWIARFISSFRYGWSLDREKNYVALLDQYTIADVKEHLAKYYFDKPEVIATILPTHLTPEM